MNIDSRLPRYQQLREIFMNEIAERNWRVGEPIPTELELAAAHNAAVGTVRKAIDALELNGVLERFQGRGTFVKRPSFQTSLFRFFRFGAPDGSSGIPESRILQRSVQIIPATVRAQLDAVKGDKGILIKRLRLFDSEPVSTEEIWLRLDLFKALLDTPDDEMGQLLYPLYETQCGQVVASADESLAAEAAEPAQAKLLHLEVGAPIIVIDRLARTYTGKAIEWRRSWGAASRFRYHITVR